MSVFKRPGAGFPVGLGLVILATAFWSTSGIFITLVVRHSGLSSVSLAFWRDLSTFGCLLGGILLVRPGLLKVQRQDLPWLALMGVVSIAAFHTAWNATVLRNGVSVANVLQANAPIFVTLVAWAIWQEPLTRIKIVALILATSGTILISRPEDLGALRISLSGVAIGLAAAGAYATLSLFGKMMSGRYSPWTVLVYAFGFGTLALLPFQGEGLRINPLSGTATPYFVGLVLVTTLSGFWLYTAGLRHLQASIASITSTTELPFAMMLAFFLFDERLTGTQWLGAFLVVSGVLLITFPRPGKRRPAPETTGRGSIRDKSSP